jgi:hypothetical protein
MTYWALANLPFFDIEDEHLMKCDQHTVHIPQVAITADKRQLHRQREWRGLGHVRV